MKKICEKLNINIFEAIEAAGTKPFGFQKFYRTDMEVTMP